MDVAMYRKNHLRNKTCMKLGKYSSKIRLSKLLLSCVFSDVSAMVLVEMGNKLMKAGSERRAWKFFDMIALRSHGGGAGRDGTAGATAP